jgi:CRISPR system Cascade subunit CasA
MATLDDSTALAALEATSFNLLRERWLPVRRRDGTRVSINPAQITDDIAGNPVVAIDWPRADFRIASLEFLIGLLATACPPADEEAWFEQWEQPPTEDELNAAFAPLACAFNLDCDGPRFGQDFDATLPDTGNTIDQLLIEAPGDITVVENRTLFVKAGRIERLSRAPAAIALYTLQTYAPSGGPSHYTSVRGGGPLTTLVLPGGDLPLWHTLWANVPQGKRPTAHDLPRVFPWLAPTRTAERVTTPADAHTLQAFWGMPRRIRLAFSDNTTEPCGLTGEADTAVVTGWGQKQHGVNYQAWDCHPLSPTYKNGKPDTGVVEWLPVHPQSDGIGYRHWAALVAGDAAGTRRPAPVLTAWQTRLADLPSDARNARLLATGYNADKAKVLSFIESEMPLPGSADAAITAATAFLAQHLIAAAEIVAWTLRGAVRAAQFRPGAAPKRSEAVAAVYEALWTTTQGDFFQALRSVVPPAGAPIDHALKQAAPDWLRCLSRQALALFDEAAPLDPSVASFDPARIVRARKQLSFALRGYGASGTKLFAALLLPAPPKSTKPKK